MQFAFNKSARLQAAALLKTESNQGFPGIFKNFFQGFPAIFKSVIEQLMELSNKAKLNLLLKN